MATAGLPIRAEYHRTYDMAARPNIVDKLVVAPGSVFFIGINPLRYPNWTMTVNDKLVEGPKPNVPAIFSGSSISSADTDFNPLPAPSASPDSSGLEPLPSPSPAPPITLGMCSFKDDTPLSAAAGCLKQIEDHSKQLDKLVGSSHDSVIGARTKYVTLWTLAESLVHSAGTITDTESFHTYRDKIGTNLDIPRQTFINDVVALSPWPFDKVAEEDAEIGALQTFYDARRAKNKSDLAALKNVSALADDSRHSAEIAKALQELRAHRVSAPQYLAAEHDRLQREVARTSKVSEQANARIDVIDAGVKRLQAFRSHNQAYGSKGELATAYERLRVNLNDIAVKRVAPATSDRFGFADTEECRGLNAGKRERNYVLALGDGRGAQVRVLCQSRMFLSAGVAFSGLAQPTYTTVAVKPTPIPAATPLPSGSPLPGAPAPAQIVAQTNNRIRATGVVLNNVRLSEPNGENGLYASFGAALTSGTTGNTNLDYVGGLSWSISRAVLVTFGLQYGPQQELPNGYKENDLVPSGTNPPNTVTRNASKFFIGITFGQQ